MLITSVQVLLYSIGFLASYIDEPFATYYCVYFIDFRGDSNAASLFLEAVRRCSMLGIDTLVGIFNLQGLIYIYIYLSGNNRIPFCKSSERTLGQLVTQ